MTGKGLKKDCRKRGVVYEIKCITCEIKEKDRIQEMFPDDKGKEKEIKVYKYLGESHRCAYERGFEHLSKLASMDKNSHMLVHMLEHHPDQDFGEVKWAMSIIEHPRTAFTRQIKEASLIQKERGNHHILNSRAEWNQCALPRLTTRMGDQEMKDWEKEISEERKKEEILEEKVRIFRKSKLKARLETGNAQKNPSKRRKTNDTNYLTIR